MSNTLNTSYKTKLLGSKEDENNLEPSLLKSLQQPLQIAGKSNIYGYTIKTDSDYDILNQGSIKHIQQQFDKQQQDNELIANPKSITAYISGNKTSIYSINNQQTIIKIIIVIIFLWLLWDFMWIK